MKKRKTPQEKKSLSYEKDRRNVYGENNKSSRKSIRKRKRWVNQSYRRTVKQTLESSIVNLDDVENVNSKVIEVKRKAWKKRPDMPLGEVLKRKGKLKKKKF
jgi:hypothetical protein